jgi:hypothetical protein
VSAVISLPDAEIFTALGNFLAAILPAGTPIVRGQTNRVAEPAGSDFVVMTPILRERIEYNTDTYQDAAFIGSIAGPTLTVTQVLIGALAIGSRISWGTTISGATVTALGTGSGGLGTYTVSPAQTVTSQILQAGTRNSLNPAKVTVQCDAHGPNSADNSWIIATLFRDEYACMFFTDQSSGAIQPLYAEDPRQMPFLNDQQQYEYMYVVDCVMQANPIVQTPQQFATAVDVVTHEIDAAYPP